MILEDHAEGSVCLRRVISPFGTGRSSRTRKRGGRRKWRDRQRGNCGAFWQALGPGLVTGAADDDPSGIATYSQAGAQFGYRAHLDHVSDAAVHGRDPDHQRWIGWQTRQGLAAQSRARSCRAACFFALVALLVVANTINIAADLAAMGEALRLVIGGPSVLYALVFGWRCLVLEVFIPYHRYAGYPEIPDAGAAGLCRGGVQRADSVGRGRCVAR